MTKIESLERQNDALRAELAELRAERETCERYLYSVIHDLRGPLSSVRVCAQTLADDPESSLECHELAQIIERDIVRADRLVCDVLDTAKLCAGLAPRVRVRSCDLTAVVLELLRELRAVHGDRFVLEAPPEITGYWSPLDLRRALWNVVSNAVKYGDPELSITLSLERTETHVSVSVHNHGTPIPVARQIELFKPFSQVHEEDGATGWGLGLWTVRGCVAAHRGQVWVRSDAASGTTFTIDLPLDARELEGATEARASAPCAAE